jgi:1,2-diacylglycerol 3-beta-glucosyltransferase
VIAAPLVLVIFLAAVQSVFLVFSLYLLVLTLAGLRRRPTPRAGLPPRARFSILIPAHNEEGQLPALLESLAKTEYPSGLYRVLVVADNCTDDTSGVARAHGAQVFERLDTVNKGKGHALRWLLDRLQDSGWRPDAYLFIDADCRVSPNFLEVMDRRFQDGAAVVQGFYTVAEPYQSAASTLRFIALALKHYARPLGRSRLGLSCGLFGTGMGFRSSILEEQAWDAFTLAEDIEYYLQLTRRGIPVEFAPEAVVSSPMPTTLGDSRSQNLRWEKGRLQMLWRHGPGLLRRGMLEGSWRKIDAVVEQAIPPLSLTVAAVLVLAAAAGVAGPPWLVGLSAVTVLAYLGHVVVGLTVAGVPCRAYGSLVHLPRYVAWKALVYCQALLPGQRQWTRTRR